MHHSMRKWQKMLALLCVVVLCLLPTLSMAGEVVELSGHRERETSLDADVLNNSNSKDDKEEPGEESDAGETASTEAEQVPAPVPVSLTLPLTNWTEMLASAAELVANPQPGQMMDARLLQALMAGRKIEGSVKIAMEAGAAIRAEMQEPFKKLLESIEMRFSMGLQGVNAEVEFTLMVAEQPAFTGKAYLANEGIVLETNLLPGKPLLISYAQLEKLAAENQASSSMTPEMLNALSTALASYGELIGSEIQKTSEAAVTTADETIAATDTRDASTQQGHLSITGEEYKTLFVTLAERFAADTELHALLAQAFDGDAEKIVEGAKEALTAFSSLESTGNAYTVDMQMDALGNLVGLDGTLPRLYTTMPEDFNVTFGYDRKSEEARAQHGFRASTTAEGNLFQLSGTVNDDRSQPGTSAGDLAMQIHVESQVEGSKPADVSLTDRWTYTIAGQTETIAEEAIITVTIDGQSPESLPDGFPANIRMTLEGTTNALEGDDFDSAIVVTAEIAGMQTTETVTVASKEFTPVDVTTVQAIDLLGLEPAQAEALMAELSAHSMQAMFAVMGRLPPELFELFTSLSQAGTF